MLVIVLWVYGAVVDLRMAVFVNGGGVMNGGGVLEL